MVQRPLFQIPISLLFLFSPQPRTAIWLHFKDFTSHLLSLGRDLGGLLHTVILSPVTPAQSLAVNGEGVRGVPWQLRLHHGVRARGPFPPRASAKLLCTYTYIQSFSSVVGGLFKHQMVTGIF